MKRWIRRAWSVFPLALLMVVVALWVAGNYYPHEAAAWWNRAWVFTDFGPQRFLLVANWDSSSHPVRRTWPYVRIWGPQTEDFQWHDITEAINPPPEFDYFGALSGYQPSPAPGTLVHWHGLHLTLAGADPSPTYRALDLDRHIIFTIPYWMATTLAGIFAIPWLIVRIRRRRFSVGKPGHCSACGYDLRASEQRCPECGAVIDLRRVWRKRPTVREMLRHVDLHIRAHAVGLLVLVALICSLILIRTWPVRYVVSTIDASRIRDPIYNHGYTLPLNVIDLCHRDEDVGWSMSKREVEALRTESGMGADVPLTVTWGFLFNWSYPNEAKLVAAINRRRGATK